MFCQVEGSLSGDAVYEEDDCTGVYLADVEGEDFAFGLGDDVSFGDDDDVCVFEHGADFPRGVDAGEVVDDAD